MKTVTLSAHFNGEHIQLDEPFALSAAARLLVTVLPGNLPDEAGTSPTVCDDDRFAAECGKLDPVEEQTFSDLGLTCKLKKSTPRRLTVPTPRRGCNLPLK